MPYSETSHSYVVASALAGVSLISMLSTLPFCMLYPDMTLPQVDMHGKTAIVTGANSGVGYECARAFASMGAHVILVCRNIHRGEEAKRKIVEDTGNNEIELELMDCGSMESVRAFVDRWGNREVKRVDVLINNAAIFSPQLKLTVDGFEQTYQVNHLSHVLLTLSLLNRGYMSPTARIISVSSLATYHSDVIDTSIVNNDDVTTRYDTQARNTLEFTDMYLMYARSKASQAIWIMALQRHLSRSPKWKNITVQACHPGYINSLLYKNMEPNGATIISALKGRALVAGAKLTGITNQQGAIVPVWLAIAREPTLPALQGIFWSRMRWTWVWPWMLENQKQDELWEKWSVDAQILLMT